MHNSIEKTLLSERAVYYSFVDKRSHIDFNTLNNHLISQKNDNNLESQDLEKIFKYFGDEKDAKQISKNIIKQRKLKKIDTQELVKIIENSKRKKNYKIHSSTKTFQALRIFVNKEISELINGLIIASNVVCSFAILNKF